MSHIVPIRKKNDKCSLNNYFPVSLLPICGKIFERINFLMMFFYSLKVFVHYLFFIKFLFFQQMIALQKIEFFLIHLKSSFHSQDIQFFVIFSFLSMLSRFKRTNGSGIIYDVMKWLA